MIFATVVVLDKYAAAFLIIYVLRYDLRSRMGAELFAQPTETAFVNPVVELHFSRKQSDGLDSQVEALDINLELRAIACDDKKTEPIDATLESSIRFLGVVHGSI